MASSGYLSISVDAQPSRGADPDGSPSAKNRSGGVAPVGSRTRS